MERNECGDEKKGRREEKGKLGREMESRKKRNTNIGSGTKEERLKEGKTKY